jgi:hypothetical protein
LGLLFLHFAYPFQCICACHNPEDLNLPVHPTYYLFSSLSLFLFHYENKGSVFLWNVSSLLPEYTASHSTVFFSVILDRVSSLKISGWDPRTFFLIVRAHRSSGSTLRATLTTLSQRNTSCSVLRRGNVFQFSDTKYVTLWTIPSPNENFPFLKSPPGQSDESGTGWHNLLIPSPLKPWHCLCIRRHVAEIWSAGGKKITWNSPPE